jgi:hypothetical protein
MTLPIYINRPETTAAILGTLLCAVNGLDTNRRTFCRSARADEDSIFDREGELVTGMDEIMKIFDLVGLPRSGRMPRTG